MLWAAARAFDEGAPASLVTQLIREARDICPAITKTALWWKVRTRRLVGSSFWSLIRIARGLAWDVRKAAPARTTRAAAVAPAGRKFPVLVWPRHRSGGGL